MSDPAPEATPAERIHEAMRDTRDDDLEECILLGHLTVAEWVGPDGQKWLSKVSGDVSGNLLPPWRERMLGFEVAHHYWSYGEDDD